MKALLIAVLVMICWVQPVISGVPDPGNSVVVPWDIFGQAYMSPGIGGDSLAVIVRDGAGAFLPGITVEIDIADCNSLCVDYPDGLTAITDFRGLALFDPRVGGCEVCDVIVRAGGVDLRTFSSVTSADWDGNRADGYVNAVDLNYFANHNPSPPQPYDSCADYNGDGVVDLADQAIFTASFSGVNLHTCDAVPCVVSPPGLDFGTVAVGSWKEKTVTITNTGAGTLSGAVTNTSLEYVVVSGGGPYILNAGESLPVRVRFEPLSSGTIPDTVETGDASCVDVSCTGVGTPAPACLVEPGSIEFETLLVGSTKDTTFFITNIGGGALSGSVDETCDHFSIVSGGGLYSLVPSETLTVTVRFEPGASGEHLCTVETGDPDCSDVSLAGAGEDPPMCTVWPDNFDFGTVFTGSFRDTTFIITNTGGGTISGTVSETCAHYSIVSGGGAYGLAGGDTLSVTMRFEPTGAGTHVCTVETGDALCSDVFCTGVGEPPPVCWVEPDTLDFGAVALGGSRDLTFAVANTGGGTLNGTIGETCPDYSVVLGGGVYSLSASETLMVTVRFGPTAEGTFACTVETGQLLCADVFSTGVGAAEPAILSITDVGNDQGRQARLIWERCSYDGPGDGIDIVGYGIYRRQDLYLVNAVANDQRLPEVTTGKRSPQIDGWDYVGTVPARGDTVYQYVAPTLCDSTISQGMCWSVFLVSATTTDPLVYYDSKPDSGYSLDNLAPSVPAGSKCRGPLQDIGRRFCGQRKWSNVAADGNGRRWARSSR